MLDREPKLPLKPGPALELGHRRLVVRQVEVAVGLEADALGPVGEVVPRSQRKLDVERAAVLRPEPAHGAGGGS